ncbi:sialate O-acetylesterase [Granulosicoccus sp. 3-233]|uniref:sialate O-acetylesterase n=1 Tax=Granulosicoccus sp. 3-233 TaxID=3417969 RepID=UPI003D32C878
MAPLASIRLFRARHLVRVLTVAGLLTVLAACDSDLRTDIDNGNDTPVDLGNLPLSGANGSASNEQLSLQVGNGAGITLQEGASNPIRVPISIERKSGAPASIQLSAVIQEADKRKYTALTFSDATLGASETSSTLSLQLAIAARPIQPQSRTLIVTASDGATPLLSTAIDISVSPTELPDVYLLVGQSNMVGFSEDNSKRAAAGEPDAPDDRILQLNVTGNDRSHYATAADFTDPASNHVTGMPLTPALDPLHDGFDTTLGGKSGQRIGPGLSFAKLALNDTSADIYLVPAAWADTGFCKRDSNPLPGLGWNATPKNNSALSGTLLYDRAVQRANIALTETGGVLRGILWHQGEADSDDLACAQAYADNLSELASALRTNIQPDARGTTARGASADVPFIVGTLSRGSDVRGDLLPFGEAKQLVDDTLRDVASLIPLSDVVINDDLVPPGYACGEGSCIHFGALAYREMGRRYYQAITGLLPEN